MIVLLVLLVTKEQYNATWMKVFYHYSGSGSRFSGYSEALNCDSTDKFSILGRLNQTFQNGGKYEFLIQYPQVSGYNRWRQSLLPYDDIEKTGNQAQGYEPVSISWNGQFWGGLVRSTQTSWTIIDGSAGHTNWWYSVGTMDVQIWPNQFPGPALTDEQWILVNCVELWIRIDHLLATQRYNAKSIMTFRSILLSCIVFCLS